MTSPMVFGLTHDFVYVGDDVSRDLYEYARGRYEQACPVCGQARKESIDSYDPVGALWSCYGCKVLWGDVRLIWDFRVPSPEEIQKYRLPNPWRTRA